MKKNSIGISILLLIIVYLNYKKLLKKQKYLGGVDFIESEDVKLKKSKDNYRNIIHNIIRMEKLLKYNNKYANNQKFLTKLNYLKLQKDIEYNNLSNILHSKEKADIIDRRLMKEEDDPASKYARLYTVEEMHQNKNIDELVNNIKFLEISNFNIYNRYNGI